MLLGQPNESKASSQSEALAEPKPDREAAEVDLSAADVFENSYSDLESILASAGPAAPLSDSVADEVMPELPREIARSRASRIEKPKSTIAGRTTAGASSATTQTERLPNLPHASVSTAAGERVGNRVQTVSFLAAVGSATIGFWTGVLIVLSRFRVVENRAVNATSQTLHNISRGVSGEFEVSRSNEQLFVVLGWMVVVVAGGLMLYSIFQLISAYGRMFWQRPLVFGSDGLTATLAVLLVFLLVATMFVHMNHVSQLGRTLVENAAIGPDENSAVAQNVRELKNQYAQLGNRFLFHMVGLALAPLLVFILSMVRLMTLPEEP